MRADDSAKALRNDGTRHGWNGSRKTTKKAPQLAETSAPRHHANPDDPAAWTGATLAQDPQDPTEASTRSPSSEATAVPANILVPVPSW